MKKNKIFLVIIVVIILAAIGYGVKQYANQSVAAAMATERAKVAEAKVAELDAQIAEKDAIIVERDGTLEAARVAAKERERWFLSQISHVETATPTQLVDQGSEILGASDIVTDGKTVTMSVETYRKIVFRLVEHKEYVEVREPSWNAREALYQAQISDLKAVVSSHEQKDVLNAGIIADLKDVINHKKSMTLLEKAAWTAGGFAAGVVVGKI